MNFTLKFLMKNDALFCHFDLCNEKRSDLDSPLVFRAVIWYYNDDTYPVDIRESRCESTIRANIEFAYPGIIYKQSAQFETGLHRSTAKCGNG